jgi:hypothetical protein
MSNSRPYHKRSRLRRLRNDSVARAQRISRVRDWLISVPIGFVMLLGLPLGVLIEVLRELQPGNRAERSPDAQWAAAVGRAILSGLVTLAALLGATCYFLFR